LQSSLKSFRILQSANRQHEPCPKLTIRIAKGVTMISGRSLRTLLAVTIPSSRKKITLENATRLLQVGKNRRHNNVKLSVLFQFYFSRADSFRRPKTNQPIISPPRHTSRAVTRIVNFQRCMLWHESSASSAHKSTTHCHAVVQTVECILLMHSTNLMNLALDKRRTYDCGKAVRSLTRM